MRSFLPVLFLIVCFLCYPVQAGTVELEDSQGYDKITIVNENYDMSSALEIGVSTAAGIDYINTGEDTYFVQSDDSLNEINLEMSVDADGPNETIPFTLGLDDNEADFYLEITKTGYSYSSILTEINVSLYDGDGFYLASDKGICLFSEYFQVCINNVGFGVSNVDTDYGLMGIYEISNYYPLIPADRITIDLSGTSSAVLCRLHVYDDSEYSEEDDDSFIMGVYWIIESIIGDPDNVIYAYFQVADIYFGWVTGLMFLMISAPFMYVFFALVCGLFSCVLRGSFSGGVAAGISTFVKVMKIPVHIVKFAANMIYGIIKILKPTG